MIQMPKAISDHKAKNSLHSRQVFKSPCLGTGPQTPAQSRKSRIYVGRRQAPGKLERSSGTGARSRCHRLEGSPVSSLAARNTLGLLAASVALSYSACSGPDRLTQPLVSEGGSYFAALGGGGNSGGTGSAPASTNDASTGDSGNDAGVAWGPTDYDATGGLSVSYQDHFNGEPCFASCHAHGITLGGTVYQVNGTDTASNAQIGVWLGGTLFTSYSGSGGNFFTNFLGNLDWTKAAIAVRNANGTTYMPANQNANGNCNACHDSRHRIVVP
jgi:hypothetical protein